MSLHDNIQNYINELQDLLLETDEQKLLDKAYSKWREDDSRYEVLEQFVESPSSSKFSKPANPPAPESVQAFDKPADPPAPESPGEQNKPIK